jgi:hypothetical protein
MGAFSRIGFQAVNISLAGYARGDGCAQVAFLLAERAR